MKRFKMNRKSSEKYFSKNGQKVHRKNWSSGPMRGGYRF